MTNKESFPHHKVINLEDDFEEVKPVHHHPEPYKSLFKKFGLFWGPLHCKTKFCKHDGGCIENTLVDSSRSFLYAYAIKTLISLAGLAIRMMKKGILKNQLEMIIKCLVHKENSKFGAFLGLMTFTLKSLICLLRKTRNKEDGFNTFFAGAIAGYLNLFFVEKNHRLAFATFFLSRAFDSGYNSMVNRGTIKKSSLNYVVIFMLLNALNVYATFHEPYLVSDSLTKFFNFVFQKGPMETILEPILPEMTKRRLVKSSILG